MEDKPIKKRGPVPDVVKIEGDWENAIDRALEKKRPKDGWPKPEVEKHKRKREE